MNKSSLGAALKPKLSDVVGERRSRLIDQLTPEEVQSVKQELVNGLKEVDPTISDAVVWFAADRLFNARVVSVPELASPIDVFVRYLGYREPKNAQMRYFLYMHGLAEPQEKPADFAAKDISNGPHNGRFLFLPRHIIRVFKWAYETGSYKKPTDKFRIKPNKQLDASLLTHKYGDPKRVRNLRHAQTQAKSKAKA